MAGKKSNVITDIDYISGYKRSKKVISVYELASSQNRSGDLVTIWLKLRLLAILLECFRNNNVLLGVNSE